MQKTESKGNRIPYKRHESSWAYSCIKMWQYDSIWNKTICGKLFVFFNLLRLPLEMTVENWLKMILRLALNQTKTSIVECKKNSTTLLYDSIKNKFTQNCNFNKKFAINNHMKPLEVYRDQNVSTIWCHFTL